MRFTVCSSCPSTECVMFAVAFEVQPRPERWHDYLGLAQQLRPRLERIEGFLENERFESKRYAGRLLSLSIWRDEKSVVRWRTQGEHHGVQEQGRAEVFEDYRLRVGEIIADTAPPAGLKLVEQRFDETETGAAKLATLTEIVRSQGLASPGGAGLPPADVGLDVSQRDLVGCEIFKSIYRPGKFALLAGWKTAAAGLAWH